MFGTIGFSWVGGLEVEMLAVVGYTDRSNTTMGESCRDGREGFHTGKI